MIIPDLTLNNNLNMPMLGLGVYQSSAEETVFAVKEALNYGYRLIDTAAAYMNEEPVGQGIRESGIERSNIFVQTKLWMSDYGYDQTLHAFDRSMRKLGLDYLDLYMMHWPVPKQFDATVESWQAIAHLFTEKRIRALGVCNFSADDLDQLIERTGVTPMVNQVELHPYFTQEEIRREGQKRQIITQAWSPIGGVQRYWQGHDGSDPLQDPVIIKIANKYNKSPAQIILRWHIELGNAVIPKSVSLKRIRENADIFNFSLSQEEVAAISALDSRKRGGPDPAEVTPQLFDFKIED